MADDQTPEDKPAMRSETATLRSLSWGLTVFLLIFIFGSLFALGRARHRAAEDEPMPEGLRKLVAGEEAGEGGGRAEEDLELYLSPEAKRVSDLVEKGYDAEEVRKQLTILQLGDTYVYDLDPAQAVSYWQRVKNEFPEDLGARDRLLLYQDFVEENRARRERGEEALPPDEFRERFSQRFAPG